jgi:Tfp pilus assembly protein PilF
MRREATMSMFRAGILSMSIIFILAGCSSAPKPKEPELLDAPVLVDKPQVIETPKDSGPGGQLFSAGISSYEDGKYTLAEKNLKEALNLGLTDPGDNVTAHKFLAFLYCASSRKTLCKEEFKKVFELDPGFMLSPAEEGHPMWRKTYREVKNQVKPVKKTP